MYNVHVCQGARAGRLYCPVSDELFGRHVDDVPGSAVPVTSFVRCKVTGCQQTDDAVVSRKTWSGSVSPAGDTHRSWNPSTCAGGKGSTAVMIRRYPSP